MTSDSAVCTEPRCGISALRRTCHRSLVLTQSLFWAARSGEGEYCAQHLPLVFSSVQNRCWQHEIISLQMFSPGGTGDNSTQRISHQPPLCAHHLSVSSPRCAWSRTHLSSLGTIIQTLLQYVPIYQNTTLPLPWHVTPYGSCTVHLFL